MSLRYQPNEDRLFESTLSGALEVHGCSRYLDLATTFPNRSYEIRAWVLKQVLKKDDFYVLCKQAPLLISNIDTRITERTCFWALRLLEEKPSYRIKIRSCLSLLKALSKLRKMTINALLLENHLALRILCHNSENFGEVLEHTQTESTKRKICRFRLRKRDIRYRGVARFCEVELRPCDFEALLLHAPFYHETTFELLTAFIEETEEIDETAKMIIRVGEKRPFLRPKLYGLARNNTEFSTAMLHAKAALNCLIT